MHINQRSNYVILIKGFTVIRYPCLSNRHDLLQGHLHTYVCQPIPCNFSFTKTLKLIRTIIDVMDYYAIYYYKKNKYIYIYINNNILPSQSPNPVQQREYVSKQDRRAEQLMKKVTKDVQRMRQGTQQSRTFNFRYATYLLFLSGVSEECKQGMT